MDDTTFDSKRRNMLAITVVLCFLKYSGATILPSSTVSAINLTISRPETLIHLLWLLWGYFFVRALQHFHHHLNNEYKRAIQKTIAPLLHPYVSHFGIPVEHEQFFHEDIQRFHNYELLFRPRAIRYTTLILWLRTFGKPRKRKRLNLLLGKPFHRRNLSLYVDWQRFWLVRVWTISTRSDAPTGFVQNIVAEQPLGYLVGLRLQLRTLAALTIFSTPFFDYRLPFIVALAPIPVYAFM
jgi:hypothetical protein